MAFRIRKHGSVIASFATAQQVDISHANDSISIGDGTNIMGPLENVGGTLCFPVSVKEIEGSGLALDATLTDGTQKTKIVNGADTVEVDDVGGEKALKVSVISSVGGGSAPAETDGANFTAGASQFTPIGGEYDADDSADLTDGKMGVIRATAERALHVHLSSGFSTLATSAKQDTIIGHVDGIEGLLTTISGNVDQLEGYLDGVEGKQDTQITALQLIDDMIFTDDAAFTPAVSKGAAIGAQCDEVGTDSVDEGDFGVLRMTAARELLVKVNQALPAGTAAIGKLAANSGVDIGDVDVTSVTCAAANAKVDVGLIGGTAPTMNTGNAAGGTQRVVLATDQPAVAVTPAGNVAHDAGDSGNPTKVGGKVVTALITECAAADRADLAMSGQGFAQVECNGSRDFQGIQQTTVTNTSETTIVSAIASTHCDIVALYVTNSSSTDSVATIKDSTTGTTRMKFLVPKGGGICIQPSQPIAQQAGVNNNWTITMGTGVSSIDITAVYTKRK